MRAEVCRDGGQYVQEYKQGKPIALLKKLEPVKTEERPLYFSPIQKF
jgi:hypothetical protein